MPCSSAASISATAGARRTDPLAVLALTEGLAVMVTEGKMAETSGARIDSWVNGAPGRGWRRDRLCCTGRRR
jgi:hypothetical protein